MRRVRDGFANRFAKPSRTVAKLSRNVRMVSQSPRMHRELVANGSPKFLTCNSFLCDKNYRKTVAKSSHMSRDLIAINKTDQNSHERPETLARMCHDCRETLARMSHDCRTVVRRSHECLTTVVRHSRECLTTVVRLSSI